MLFTRHHAKHFVAWAVKEKFAPMKIQVQKRRRVNEGVSTKELHVLLACKIGFGLSGPGFDLLLDLLNNSITVHSC